MRGWPSLASDAALMADFLPSLAALAKGAAGGAPAAPRVVDLGALTPAEAFARLADFPGIAFLDSNGPAGERAAFSTIALLPRAQLRAEHADAAVFGALRAMLAGIAPVGVASDGGEPAPFTGGVIGYLGYGMASACDRAAVNGAGSLGLSAALFHAYDTVLSFDRARGQARLIAGGAEPGPDIARIMAALARPPTLPANPPLCFAEETPREVYLARVARIISLIEAGDIYQANFTARLLAARPAGFSPARAYLALREASPAPFSAFLDCGGGTAIASVSPERFVRVDGQGGIESRPIKGTIAAGSTDAEQAARAATLRASAKDRAENLMITDLLRNDIARVAAGGSVHVPRLCEIEAFAGVLHLVSEIRARLRPGCDAIDLLRATFPGGSVTGAPKIRAMEIIAGQETAERGAYCGSVVALGADGRLDSSIIIRTAVIGRDQVALQAGGGIVADSDPALEYAEMQLKIARLRAALEAGG